MKKEREQMREEAREEKDCRYPIVNNKLSQREEFSALY